MLARCLLMALLVIQASYANGQSQDLSADLIITHGKLYGVEDITADTVAIQANRIIAIGKLEQLEKLIQSNTKIIDAAGSTVTPGLHDAHVHFLSGSLSLSQIDLSEANSISEIEAKIKSFVKAHPDQKVLVGRGWLYGAFPEGLPTKAILDQMISDRPAIMRCYDGHSVWLNSKALELAKITRDTPDPKAGIIVRDAKTGEPKGVLKESAQDLIESIIPKPTSEEKLAALRQGISHAHRLGLTSVCEAGVGKMELELLETLRAKGELNLRFAIALEGKRGMTKDDIDQLEILRRSYPKLNIRAVKLYVDGVIEAHTAVLLDRYANRNSFGLRETNPIELDNVIDQLDQLKWQIMVHAVGDGGVQMTLNAMEAAASHNPRHKNDRRHRLEHIETISKDDIHRFGQSGIIASMQPYHANPNSNIFNVWAVNLGPDRASRAWAWKSIVDSGGQLAFGSDWPVVSLDPRLGMHVAVTRQTLNGQPAEGFVPEQRLTLQQALDAYTKGAAYAQFAETEQGSLKVGLLADIAIWDRDLFVAPLQIQFAQVKYTIFDGKVVHQRSDN